jgi:hypothetical protein
VISIRARRRPIRVWGLPVCVIATTDGTSSMGKYFLAWLLGVPAIVLVLIYFFFH